MGTLAAYATALLAIEQRGNAGQLGLVLSYALQITGATSICVRLASITENSFNAVERVGEYSELPSEPRGPPDVEPPDEWPQHGEVCIQLPLTSLLHFNSSHIPSSRRQTQKLVVAASLVRCDAIVAWSLSDSF